MSDLPPVWVISLARARERRAFVGEAFGAVGLPFEMFDAVDGTALTDAQRQLYSPRRAAYEYGRELGRGMFACSLSHLEVWRRMVELDIPELVVFEDDTRPLEDFATVLEGRHLIPDDWDVVTFHSLFEWATPRPLDGSTLAGRYQVCRFERTPMGTQAYLIKLRAAKRLVDIGLPIGLPPDELLYRPRPAALSVYGIDPPPVVHEDFPSELRSQPAPLIEHSRLSTLALDGVSIVGKVVRRARRSLRSRPR